MTTWASFRKGGAVPGFRNGIDDIGKETSAFLGKRWKTTLSRTIVHNSYQMIVYKPAAIGLMIEIFMMILKIPRKCTCKIGPTKTDNAGTALLIKEHRRGYLCLHGQ